MLCMSIQNEGLVSGLNVVYLMMLHDTQYQTCEHLQECSLQREGRTLIQFKGSRVSLWCCVLVCKPCMLFVRHKLRISLCVSERTHNTVISKSIFCSLHKGPAFISILAAFIEKYVLKLKTYLCPQNRNFVKKVYNFLNTRKQIFCHK
jgi:hypothetical protein